MHKVDLAETGGTAVLDDGTEIGFARLALATGSVPRALPTPGADLPGVLSLRTIDDAAAIRAELDRAGHVVVIGGGFVGLEVATAAAKRGAAVTVVEAPRFSPTAPSSPRIWSSSASAPSPPWISPAISASDARAAS